jgi:antitoxin component YwqK of YwqJK toxin-antitoxin module
MKTNQFTKQKDGLVKEFFSDGKLSIVGKYENGKKIGTWKYYDVKGNLSLTKNY